MRKILIIPNGTIEQYKNLADENNIAEIVEGIPPSLTDQYTDNDLPVIHEEPPPPPPKPDPIEQLRIEQSQANTELFELVLMLTQGV